MIRFYLISVLFIIFSLLTIHAQDFWEPSNGPYEGGEIRSIANDGGVFHSINLVVDDNSKAIPSEFSLDQNYPNPFNPTTTINYSIPKQSSVTIKIYDVPRKKVRTLVNEIMQPGFYKIKLDRSRFRQFSFSKKVLLLIR